MVMKYQREKMMNCYISSKKNPFFLTFDPLFYYKFSVKNKLEKYESSTINSNSDNQGSNNEHINSNKTMFN